MNNPYLSAAGAAGYIWAIALFFRYMEAHYANTPDTIVAPILMLSLLVFSVATMGFLFFYRPATLFIEHKRSEAVLHFVKTLSTFAALQLAVVVLVTTILQ